MSFLLDTNVLSELRKRERANRHLLRWFDEVDDEAIYLSVLVLGEIRRGTERVRLRDPRSAAALERWHRELVSEHADRILGIDRDIADAWGRMNVPDPLPVIDGLLAATAQVHDLTVVTRNTRDIARTGVPCLDPFVP